MKSKFMTFLAAMVVVLVAACTQSPPSTVMPDLTFEGIEPVFLNVARLEIIDNYTPPMREPNIEQRYKTTPSSAVRALVEKQLKPAGAEKLLRVIVENAAVVQEDLPITKGVVGAFKQEAEARYNADVSLRFELAEENAPDIVTGHAQVIAKRNRSIMKSASPYERDKAYFDLLEDTMADVSDGLKTVVKNTFGRS